jgi:hypothetical protein
MTVAEVIKDLLELDQGSNIFFTHPEGLPYIYAVAKSPEGEKVIAEMPTATLKLKKLFGENTDNSEENQ